MFNNKRGMTLIEVSIALLILSFSIIPLLTSIIAAKKQVASTERKAAALYTAQGILEDALHQNYEKITDLLMIDGELNRVDAAYGYTEALDIIAQVDQDLNIILPASTESGRSYTVEVTEQNSLKKIIVTVYYLEPSVGRETSIKLVGARAKR